ncbi:MAG: protease modulator HflK [Ruminococcaceae bacterium]|nr:protease modulator HflK [Oscillospiraceae bacterium]
MKKKQTVLGDVLETVTKYFLIVVAVVVLFILFSGIRVVKSGNVALVLRFGKLVGDNYEEQVHEPGLLFAFPYFIDEVITVPTGNVVEQSVTTHYTPDGQSVQGLQGGYLITGDQNIAVVSASVKYTITDPVAYALHVKDISLLVDTAVSNAMVCESANMEVDSLLTDGKDDFASAILKRATEKLELMQAGVTIASVELTQVAAPEEVRDSFQAVNAASVQAETVVQRAKTYESTLIPEAHAKANATVAKATSAKAAAISAANVELAEFMGIAEELSSRRAAIYAAHGHDAEVTSGCAECDETYATVQKAVETRLYTDRFAAAIAKIKKVYLVSDGDNKIIIDP